MCVDASLTIVHERENDMRTISCTLACCLTAAVMVSPNDVLAAHSHETRPNILWLTSEDNSISWVSCYGGKNCRTPNIDRLAEEGFRYIH